MVDSPSSVGPLGPATPASRPTTQDSTRPPRAEAAGRDSSDRDAAGVPRPAIGEFDLSGADRAFEAGETPPRGTFLDITA